MFKSKGRIVYDPKRNMDKDTKWWCVLEIGEDLPEYLRWFLDREWYNFDASSIKRKYHRPPHSPHISIIRGEIPKSNKDSWGSLLRGKKLEFEYNLDIKHTRGFKNEVGEFFFVKAVFPEYNEIRAHYGLDTEKNGQPFRGHITFARTYQQPLSVYK